MRVGAVVTLGYSGAVNGGPLPDSAASRRPQLVHVVLLGLVLGALGCRFWLLFTLNAHWDEYNFLRFVHEAWRGELSERLQTFHVHFFGWLQGVDGLEIDQVLAARQVVFLLQVLGALALWRLGARLLSEASALFSVFVTCSFSYVLLHGTAFRYDGILTPLCLLAAWLLVASHDDGFRRRRAAAAGVLTAIALLVSVKAVFFFPTLLILALVPLQRSQVGGGRPAFVLRSFAYFVGSCFVVGGALYALHRWQIESQLIVSDGSLLGMPGSGSALWARKISQQMLRAFFPRRYTMFESVLWDVGTWALIVIGLVLLIERSVREAAWRRRALLVLAAVLPLFTVFFYRNAWPYYWVMILPGTSLLAGVVVYFAERSLLAIAGGPVRQQVIIAVVALALASPVGFGLVRIVSLNAADQNVGQRTVLAAVHEIFPAPVRYIDRCGMVASFPKVGPFMSSLTALRYRGRPVMREVLKNTPPVFVLANISALELEKPWQDDQYSLYPKDFVLLKKHFIHHWGPIWVAGSTMNLSAGVDEEVQLWLAGSYTLEAAAAVYVDGKLQDPGAVLSLSAGKHLLRSDSPGAVSLRIGDHLPRPSMSAPREPLFVGFQFSPDEAVGGT